MLKKKQKSAKKIEAIVNRRNSTLNDVEKLSTGFSCQGIVGEFLDYYFRCELFARKLIDFNKRDNNLSSNKINTLLLTQSLSHLNIHFNNDHLLIIFKGGQGKRGSKSARQLRNGYLHELSEKDKNEILEKHHEYTLLMKKFLQLRLKNALKK